MLTLRVFDNTQTMTTSYNPEYDKVKDIDEDVVEEKKKSSQDISQSSSISSKTKNKALSKHRNKNISTVEKIISITPTCYLKPKAFVGIFYDISIFKINFLY